MFIFPANAWLFFVTSTPSRQTWYKFPLIDAGITIQASFSLLVVLSVLVV
jgi:hypothetical protein